MGNRRKISVALLLISIFISAMFSSEAAIMGMIKVSGKVIYIDSKLQQVMIITADSKEIIFKFDRNIRVLGENKKRYVLSDIKIGSKIEISYIIQDSKNTVVMVRLL
jgi:hypothetical protein